MIVCICIYVCMSVIQWSECVIVCICIYVCISLYMFIKNTIYVKRFIG